MPPVPPTYGVTISATKAKTGATFTIRNTGSTAREFRIAVGGGRKPPKPAKVGYQIAYTLDGRPVAGSAAATLAPGATAKVILKLKNIKKFAKKRTIVAQVEATSIAAPATTAQASTKIVIKASK